MSCTFLNSFTKVSFLNELKPNPQPDTLVHALSPVTWLRPWKLRTYNHITSELHWADRLSIINFSFDTQCFSVTLVIAVVIQVGIQKKTKRQDEFSFNKKSNRTSFRLDDWSFFKRHQDSTMSVTLEGLKLNNGAKTASNLAVRLYIHGDMPRGIRSQEWMLARAGSNLQVAENNGDH